MMRFELPMHERQNAAFGSATHGFAALEKDYFGGMMECYSQNRPVVTHDFCGGA